MRNVAIVGAGMTTFGEHFALGLKDLLPLAFTDCSAQHRQGVWTSSTCRPRGTARWEPPTDFPAGILADTLGLPDIPVTRVENSCATGNDAVRNALFAVASGASTWRW